MSQPACDVLVLAPHPDDAEIGCGGSILQLVAKGHRVAIADLTRGELGSRGDAAAREREAREATRLLGLCGRDKLGLADGGIRDDDASCREVVAALRRWQPRLLLAPHGRDFHPDHAAAAALVRRAWFLAGLAKAWPELGAAVRPRQVLWYPANEILEVDLVVDVSAVAERKREVIACYGSQVDIGDRGHLVRGLDLLERVALRDAAYGSRIGRRAGEGFVADPCLAVADAAALMA